MKINLKPPVIKNQWSSFRTNGFFSAFSGAEIRSEGAVVPQQSAIEDYDEKKTLKVARNVHRLCHISKLIAENEFVSLTYEAY